MADLGQKIVPDKYQPGIYYIEGQQWSVGTRYTLCKVLGSGSFSSVCSALDSDTQEQVALKRIPDVLLNSENAKRVLREVCILRRLEHPHIIGLKDVFLKPSSSGRFVYRQGSLVPTSLDLYLALEYCDQGDLFHMRGQLSEAEVKAIMLQLFSAVQYLHRNGVWHRDIKTANILMTYTNGVRHIKLADLGSARSTLLEQHLRGAGGLLGTHSSNKAYQPQAASRGDGSSSKQQQQTGHMSHKPHSSMDSPTASADGKQQQHSSSSKAEGGETGRHGSSSSSRLLPWGPPVHHSDSFLADAAISSAAELYARPVAGGGFKSPLTRMVCTPCYRAPEVVMSRGHYTEAIDMWGCGCVFGELIQRVAWIGKATTPQLQVGPVFAIHGMPLTPVEGEHFIGPSNNITRTELSALFAVIGTPSWKCIEGVDNPAWRQYLEGVPGKAPTLFRRFGAAGEIAVDLLARLLSFDPARRCSCDEAMAHEYFEEIIALALGPHGSGDLDMAIIDSLLDGHKQQPPRQVEPQQQQQQQPQPMEDIDVYTRPPSILKRARSISTECPQQRTSGAGAVATTAAAAAAGSNAEEMDVDCMPTPQPAAGGAGHSPSVQHALPPLPPAAAVTSCPSRAGLARGGEADTQQQQQQVGLVMTPSEQHYYEFDDPATALAALEHDMAALMTDTHQAVDVVPGGPTPPAPQPLRELLEREVAEHQAHLARRRGSQSTSAATSDTPGAAAAAARASPVKSKAAVSPLLLGSVKKGSGVAAGSIARQWQHLQPDPGPSIDASRIGYQRLPHHADAEKAHLEPEQHLRAGRHGEWTQDTLQATTRSGAVWG